MQIICITLWEKGYLGFWNSNPDIICTPTQHDTNTTKEHCCIYKIQFNISKNQTCDCIYQLILLVHELHVYLGPKNAKFL